MQTPVVAAAKPRSDVHGQGAGLDSDEVQVEERVNVGPHQDAVVKSQDVV